MAGRIARPRLHLTRSGRSRAVVSQTDDPASTLLTLLDFYVAYPPAEGAEPVAG
jgi:hypothetical protein